MSPTAPPAPAERFARLIEGLCRAIAARGVAGRLAVPLIVLLWARLRRTAARVAMLAARLRAGTLPAGCARRRSGRSGPPPRRLPRGFAWLVRLVPEAACSASQLQHLLGEPEMAALIAAAPQMRRMLRPLCRMLGVHPPPGLLAPPQARRAPPSRPAAAGGAPPAGPRRPPRLRMRGGVPGPAPLIDFRACGPPISG